MAKAQLSDIERFERKMKNLEAGVPYVYYTGRDLGFARGYRPDVDYFARFCWACCNLGYAALFQRRNRDRPTEFEYIVVLHERLGMRKDGNGRFQEAQRVAGY